MSYTFDTLATFKTIAEFEGIQHLPCHFRTALCPDRCGHAKDVAIFNIVEVVEYSKPGEYGDDKDQKKFFIDMNPNEVVQEQSADIIDKVKTCVAGKKYYLDWDHIYVKDENGQSPVRPCKRIAPVE